MAGVPFMSGKDVLLTFRQNSVPVVINVKSISVKEVADESVDEVNGEDRGRPQKITDYFEITIDAYTPDLKLLRAWLDYVANEDSNALPLNQVLGLRFKKHDTTREAFVAKECTPGAFNIDMNGRKERVMQRVTVKARYFEAAKAA